LAPINADSKTEIENPIVEPKDEMFILENWILKLWSFAPISASLCFRA
jgi:hypothetical protein